MKCPVILAPAVLAAAVCVSTPAFAEKWDLSTMTCRQFVTSDKTTIMVILTWLDAYYKDGDAPPVIDTDTFTKNAERLGEYCAANPDIGLITAADHLFDD